MIIKSLLLEANVVVGAAIFVVDVVLVLNSVAVNKCSSEACGLCVKSFSCQIQLLLH